MSFVECGFDRLSELNDRRAGEQYHEISAWSPMQWGCALAGEAGELCNAVKKLERARPEDVERQSEIVANIGEEAADIIIYLDLLIKRVNQVTGTKMYLRDLLREKFNKTSAKIESQVFWTGS